MKAAHPSGYPEDWAEYTARRWSEWGLGRAKGGDKRTVALLQSTRGLAWEMKWAEVLRNNAPREVSQGPGALPLAHVGPLALARLNAEPAELVQDADYLASLTHPEQDARDAAVLVALAIRHAVLYKDLNVRGQIEHLPKERQAKWTAALDEALKSDASAFKDRFTDGSTASVAALQCALIACRKGKHLRPSLEEAVKGGSDIAQVASTVGALMGAYDGAESMPSAWVPKLHGWLQNADEVELQEWPRPGNQAEEIGNCVKAVLKGPTELNE